MQVSQPMAAPAADGSASGRGVPHWSSHNHPAGSSFGRHPLGTSPYGRSVDMVDLVERLMDRESCSCGCQTVPAARMVLASLHGGWGGRAGHVRCKWWLLGTAQCDQRWLPWSGAGHASMPEI